MADELVVVYQAQDRPTADIVASLLESEGIRAVLQSSATAWGGRSAIMDVMGRRQSQYWGDVLVASSDIDKSLEIIRAYAPSEPEEPAETEMSWTGTFSETSIRMPYIVAAFFSVIVAASVWSGDNIAIESWSSVAAMAALIYGTAILKWQQYVPPRFRCANKNAGYCLIIVGIMFAALSASALGLYCVPRPIWLGTNLTVALACIYGAIKRIPMEDQDV